MRDARGITTESYKPLCSHTFVANDDERPELATNERWREIMKKARKDHELSQEQLGAKVGCTQEMIWKIETGKSTSSEFILPICKHLGIAPPMHFVTDEQRRWDEIGTWARHRTPEQFAATMKMLEAMKQEFDRMDAEAKTREEQPATDERRK